MNCPICGSGDPQEKFLIYQICSHCGHQFSPLKESFIVNDELKKPEKISGLERFKIRTCLKTRKQNGALIDIGSGSGNFLYHIRSFFTSHLGIEVTPECIRFSRETLGLNVSNSLSDFRNGTKVSLVTMWHSLEHLDLNIIHTIFEFFSKNLDKNSRLIISVPNVQSLQFRLFGPAYPYLDLDSHCHQFTSNSLITLLDKCGYQAEGWKFSLQYSLFGYLQGFLNQFQKIHNFFYYRKKRGWTYQMSPNQLARLDLYNYVLAALFLPISLVFSAYDFFFPKRSGVITVVFSRKD